MNQSVVGDKGRETTEVTVLYRQNGMWEKSEVGILVSRLNTQCSEDPLYFQYALLLGRYDEHRISALLSTLGGKTFPFTVTFASMGDTELPFQPCFLGM